PPVAGNLSHRAGGDVPDTARDTARDVDHVGTSHPPLPRSPVLVLVVLVHVISFPLVGRPLDAPAWWYRSDGNQRQVGLGLDTGLDWGWTRGWTGSGTQKGPPREGGPSVFSSVLGWRDSRQGLDPVEVVGRQGDVAQLRQVVAPDRLQAGFLGELLGGDASGREVGGAVRQRLDLGQVPPVDGGDLTFGPVQVPGHLGLNQLPDVAGSGGSAPAAG